MPETKKPSKYVYAKSGLPRPVMVDTGKGPAAVIGTSFSKHKDTGKVYSGVKLSMGYKSDFGFNRNQFNGTVELPKGLSNEEKTKFMQEVLEAWNKLDAEVAALDQTKLVFENA